MGWLQKIGNFVWALKYEAVLCSWKSSKGYCFLVLCNSCSVCLEGSYSFHSFLILAHSPELRYVSGPLPLWGYLLLLASPEECNGLRAQTTRHPSAAKQVGFVTPCSKGWHLFFSGTMRHFSKRMLGRTSYRIWLWLGDLREGLKNQASFYCPKVGIILWLSQ